MAFQRPAASPREAAGRGSGRRRAWCCGGA